MSMAAMIKEIDTLGEMCTGLPDGLPSTMLHMYDDKSQMYVVALRLDQQPMISPMARLVIAKQDPAMAIVVAEARIAITQATVEQENDPDRQRLLRGEVSVSGMPANKRHDVLMLAGEDRDGNSLTRMWISTFPSTPGWPRMYKPFETAQMEALSSRLHPMYMFRELMAQNARLTAYQARKLARDQAIKELARMGVREQQMPPPPLGWKPSPLH